MAKTTIRSKFKPKFSFSINYNKAFLTIIAAIVTAVFLSTIIISFPQTENLYNKIRYDLTFEQPFWSKEYTLEFTIKPEDYNEKDKKIAETKSILLKRLRNYGVQKITFKDLRVDDKKKARLKIQVETDRDQAGVDRLVAQRYYIRFVTRKEGINFEDEKNQFVQFDPANYNPTPYTRHDFRTVYITKLKASTGDYAYFGIYKPWEHKAGDFYKFMDKYAGQYAGLEIDGFVTPIVVPLTAGQSGQAGVVSRQPFALGVGNDKDVAQGVDLMFNSGVIPLSYTQSASQVVSLHKLEVDHVKTLTILLGITIAITMVIMFAHVRLDLRNVAAYFLSITTMITLAKLFSFPVHMVILLYSMILATVLMPLFISSFRTSGILLVTTLFIYIFRIGYIRDMAFYLFVLIALFIFYERAVKVYTSLIQRIFK